MTTRERENLARRTFNKANYLERAASEELLRMGVSYKFIGAFYLRDAIIYVLKEPKGTYHTVREITGRAIAYVSEKYRTKNYRISVDMCHAVEETFIYGNIDYLLDVFKATYNYDTGKVSNASFIMTTAEKIRLDMEESQSFNATQLRILIQGSVENITDATALENLYGIVQCLEGGVIA